MKPLIKFSIILMIKLIGKLVLPVIGIFKKIWSHLLWNNDHIVLHTKVLTSKKSITLSAIDKYTEMTWATKIIEIYPQMGNRDSVLVIADHEFLVKEQASRAGLDRPLADCIFDKKENLPVIYFDNYNVLVNSSSMNPIQQAVNSIVIAALSYLVQNNSIDAKEIPLILQEFLLFANKKVNFTTK